MLRQQLLLFDILAKLGKFTIWQQFLLTIVFWWKKVVILSIYSVFPTSTQPDSKIKSESSESNQFCRKIGPINYSRCLLFLCFMESNTTFPNHEKVTTKHWKELQFSPFEVSILSSLLTALLCRLTHARCTLIQNCKTNHIRVKVLIRMSNWRRRATEGAKFWISCKQPAFLSNSKFSILCCLAASMWQPNFDQL